MAPLVVKDKVLYGNSGGEFGVRGWLTAVDAGSGKIAWRAYATGPDRDVLIGPHFKFMAWSGTLATAGDVVFYGTMEGWFKAIDARSGQSLWQSKTGSGIIGQPVTYRGSDGKQYVAVLSDVGPPTRRSECDRDRRAGQPVVFAHAGVGDELADAGVQLPPTAVCGLPRSVVEQAPGPARNRGAGARINGRSC